jgi:hypothetical protein
MQAGLPALRTKAELARRLHERLFGAVGTNWISASFIEQSETMGTILRVIEQDQLQADLTAVVGDELPKLLGIMQIQYEDMVSARMSRERGPSENLRVLRERLRFRLNHYKTAVEMLRDPDDPKSYDIVSHALRSLVLLNERVSSGASTQEIEEFADAELVDLDPAQEQAADGEGEAAAEAEPEPEPAMAVNA